MNEPLVGASALPPLPRPAYKDRRGWLIAFGVVEILIACFFLLMAVFSAVLIPNMPRTPGQPPVPGGLFYIVAIFYAALGAVFAVAGIGSIGAKNWARILTIALSSLWLAFGVLGTVCFIAVMPMVIRQQEAILQQNPAIQGGQLPPNFMGIMMVMMIIFQLLIMVLLPLIFLIFYTRKNVKATCEALAAPASSAYPAASFPPAATGSASAPIVSVPASAAKGLPVPIIIAIVCFLFYGLSALAGLWLPITLFFGVILHGAMARLVVIALAAVGLYCAWCFYKLRIQGWWAAVSLFVVLVLSGIVTLIKVDLRSFYDEVYRQMGMDPQQMSPFTLIEPNTMHFLMAIGWLVWAAIFVFLIYTKRYFRPQ